MVAVALTVVLASFALPARAAEVAVFAAASLADACAAIGRGFERSRPGTKVVLNTGASGLLLRQIEQGAPADVFLSADEQTMDQAAARSLVDPATRRVVAGNALVLAVPPSGGPGSLAALAEPSVARIAMGNPDTVPAGRYARAALIEAGLFEVVMPRLILAENVRQALEYLVRGEVDAAFVFATDARKAGEKVQVSLMVPTADKVTYPAAVVSSAPDKEGAKAFLQYMASSEAQAVLAAHGFTRPDAFGDNSW